MPEKLRAIATHIHVDAVMFDRTTEGKRFSLTINGEEFPWCIAEDGVSTAVTDEGVPAVTITILAEQVTVNHRIEDPTREDQAEAIE